MRKLYILFSLALLATVPFVVMAGDQTDGKFMPDTINGTQIMFTRTRQTLANGGTVNADACGGVKVLHVNGTDSITTSTTNTFTAPTPNLAGCTMVVLSTTADVTVTLDDNTLFNTTGNIDLGQYDTAWVSCDGSKWVLLSTSDN